MRFLIPVIALSALASWLLMPPRSEPAGQANSYSPSHYAEIDADGTVLRVIVATEEFIQSGQVGDPSRWIETDYEGKTRKNYAGKGYRYDPQRDAFIPPKPSAEATLDEKSMRWIEPVKPKKGITATTTRI
jgi:hypothetical protein